MKLIFEYNENDSQHISSIQDLDDNENNNEERLGKYIPVALPNGLLRKELPLPNVSEPTVVRHYTNVSHLNYGIDIGFYPLGSCTMKYNPRVNEDIARLDGFQNLHPLSHEDCNQGSLQLMWDLEQDLKTITGMDAFSLQPAAGAQAELLGVMMTKAYFSREYQKQRTKIIIPDSAHGTNPATASMCRFKTITIPSDTRGNLDIDKFRQALQDDVALVMLTNPNTLGLFEENILEISDLAH